MSFFGSKKKSQPAPRPVTKKIAKATPAPVIDTAAEAEKAAMKRRKRSRTQLTGPRGIQDEARTRFKSLLGGA